MKKIPDSYISISKALHCSVRGVAQRVGGAAGHGADPVQAARHAGVGAGHRLRFRARVVDTSNMKNAPSPRNFVDTFYL